MTDSSLLPARLPPSRPQQKDDEKPRVAPTPLPPLLRGSLRSGGQTSRPSQMLTLGVVSAGCVLGGRDDRSHVLLEAGSSRHVGSFADVLMHSANRWKAILPVCSGSLCPQEFDLQPGQAINLGSSEKRRSMGKNVNYKY